MFCILLDLSQYEQSWAILSFLFGRNSGDPTSSTATDRHYALVLAANSLSKPVTVAIHSEKKIGKHNEFTVYLHSPLGCH